MLEDFAVLPTYHDVYGVHGSEDDLVKLIQEYDVQDWLLHLARLSNLLCGHRHRDALYVKPFLEWFRPPALMGKLNEVFENNRREGRKTYLFTDRHIGILIELALLHAPRNPSRRIEKKEDLHRIFTALLILADLEDFSERIDTSTDEGKATFVDQVWVLWGRSELIDPQETIPRGAYLYQIADPNQSPEAVEWGSLFRQATGHGLVPFFMGGVCTLLPEYARTPAEIGKTWLQCATAVQGKEGKMLPDVPSAYHERRAISIEALATAVQEHEKGNAIPDFNLIGLKKYPLLRAGDGGVFPLYASGIADSLCEGIFQDVARPAIDGLIDKDHNYVSHLFGLLFEQYVLGILAERFGTYGERSLGRLIPSPVRSDNGNQAADAILLCEEGIVILEVKGWHVAATHRFAVKPSADVAREIISTGLDKAVTQLQKSVECCRRGLVRPELPYRDLQHMLVCPMAVTYVQIPLFEPMPALIGKLEARAKVDDFTCPLVLAHDSEVGLLCSLPEGESFWRVLVAYSNASGSRKSLNNFLVATCPGVGELLARRAMDRWERLKREVGF